MWLEHDRINVLSFKYDKIVIAIIKKFAKYLPYVQYSSPSLVVSLRTNAAVF